MWHSLRSFSIHSHILSNPCPFHPAHWPHLQATLPTNQRTISYHTLPYRKTPTRPHSHTWRYTYICISIVVISQGSNRPASFCVWLLTNVFPIVSPVSHSASHYFWPSPFHPNFCFTCLLRDAYYNFPHLYVCLHVLLSCNNFRFSHFCTALTLHWGQLPCWDYIQIKVYVTIKMVGESCTNLKQPTEFNILISVC